MKNQTKNGIDVRNKNRVAGKMPVRLFVLLIVAALITGAFITLYEAKQADIFMRDMMLSEAKMLAKALDYKHIMKLTGSKADTLSAEYKLLNQQIVNIREANPRYRYLYLMGKRKNSPPFFFMGTEPPGSEYYSPPGQVYADEAPTLAKVFSLQEADVSDPVTDKWGTWISALAPIKNPVTGELLAVFGMDFDAREWNEYIFRNVSSSIAITALAVFFLAVLLLLFRYRQINREKEVVLEAAKELEKFFLVSPDLLCIIDTRGNFLRVNKELENILGYDFGVLVGRTFFDFVHPEDLDSAKEAIAKTDGQDKIFNLTNRYLCKEGAYHFLEWRLSSRGVLIYAAARDISESKKAMESLRENRRLLADIIENSGALIVIKDIEGKYQLVNQKWEEATGLKREAVLGKTDEVLFPGETGKKFMENDRQVIKSGSTFEIEEKMDSVEGTRFFISIKFPIRNGRGEISGVCGMITDITERKKVEEALRESEEKFRRISDNISDVVFTTDLGMNTTYISPSVEKLIGDPPDIFIKRSLEERYPPESIQIIQAVLMDELEKEKDPNVDKDRTRIIETEYYRSDRSIINVSTHVSFIRDDKGNPIGFQGITRDITERKRAEESLRESEEKLSALFASMTEMVVLHEVVLDLHGQPENYRITDCNSAYTKITGIKHETAVGRLATEVYGTDSPPYLQEFCTVGITGEPCHFETYFPPMDKHFSISVVSPAKNKFATISTDITEAKKAQQLIASKNKELEQIIYVASHDLRSPLVNVEGYGRELEYAVEEFRNVINSGSISTEEIESTIRSVLPEMTEALNHIRNSARQMDALLKGLLKLSRLGRSALTVTTLNMNELIGKVCSTFEFQLKESHIQLNISDLPPCNSDLVQTTQVFSNLIGNAIKYLDPNRSGIINITGHVESGRSRYCIEDNGIGIAVEHREKIFELFHRLNPSKSEGEGLGLTIVSQILSRIDGEIHIESETGKGSRFYITLPFARMKE